MGFIDFHTDVFRNFCFIWYNIFDWILSKVVSTIALADLPSEPGESLFAHRAFIDKKTVV